MEYNISSFLENAEPQILRRGRKYYDSDMVKNLQKSGRVFTAKVSGSEYRPYHVEITFDEDGDVDEWECNCPYDWGPVCKHIVATLLAIEDGGYEEQTPSAKQLDDSEDNLADLVNQANVELLKNFVIGQCRKDQRLRLETLSILGAAGQEELAAVKNLIEASIREHCSYGYYDDCNYDAVCGDVRESLEKARRRMERKEYPLALELLQYLLTTCAELLNKSYDEYDESDLSDSVEMILDLIKKCASLMAESAKADELRRQLDSILATADSSVFDEWDDYRYELLQCAAPLADKQSAKEIYDLLNKWDASPDSEYYASQNKETRYYIISAVDGPGAARAYLEQNLDVDVLRVTAIRQDIEHKNYTNAERLCLDKVDFNAEETYYRPDQWNYLLYEIYEKWGEREKQVLQARQMVLQGDWSYYKIYKEAMLASGQWEKEYPKLRDKVRDVRSSREYMRLLSDEQDVELLMEQVRLYPSEVFTYGAVVVPRYGAEVYTICVNQVREGARQASNRKRYQELCRMIRSLYNFGGRKEALDLIDELAQAYPRRRAMLEELRNARAVCEKKG